MFDLLTGLNGYLIGGGAIILAFVGTYVRGRLSGAKLERDKQSGADLAARDIRDQMQNDVGAPARCRARRTRKEGSEMKAANILAALALAGCSTTPGSFCPSLRC